MELDEHDRAGGDRFGEIRGFGARFQDWMLTVETPVGEPTRVAVHRECFLDSILPDRKTSPDGC